MPGPQSQLEWLLSYFHLDWGDEYDRWEEVVDLWITESSAAQIRDAASQIEELLPSANDSQEFAIQLSRLGCDFDPRADEGGYRAWLTAVRNRLLASQTGDEQSNRT